MEREVSEGFDPTAPSVRIEGVLPVLAAANAQRSRQPLAPRLQTVPAVAMRMQLRAASLFFQRLDTEYVPWPVTQRLKMFDVSFALFDFACAVGLDYDILTSPSHPLHSSQREALGATVGILVAAEYACRGTSLSPIPVLHAISVSHEAAEALVERLELASVVSRMLDGRPHAWDSERAFRADANENLKNWETLARTDLDTIAGLAFRYDGLRRHVDLLSLEVCRAVADIRHSATTADAQELAAYAALELDEILEGIARASGGTISESIQRLEELRAAVLELLGSTASAADEIESLVSRRASCLGVLGLTEDADLALVIRTYRKLMKEVHPDRHPDDPNMVEVAARVNAAYTELRKMDWAACARAS